MALTEAVLLAAGYQTAAYTSPHIHRYNERLRINGRDVEDASLCEAFEAVAAARGEVSLTYFEFGTLAALWIIAAARPDVAILEVGMGGRLDAVNIIDTDIAIISHLGLDHQDWLGHDLDSIGYEKAGIMRSGKPVICGDTELPDRVTAHARSLSAPVYQQGRRFGWLAAEQGHWHWWGEDRQGRALRFTDLPPCRLHRDNCATALQAIALLPLAIPDAAISRAVAGVQVPGRFEMMVDQASGQRVLFDVAHNPSAAALLARQLRALQEQDPSIGRIAVVLAMMADKDVKGFLGNLESVVDIWYIAGVDQPRAMAADKLAQIADESGLNRSHAVYGNPLEAYRGCTREAGVDLVVITGSFFTVAAVRGAVTSGVAGQGR